MYHKIKKFKIPFPRVVLGPRIEFEKLLTQQLSVYIYRYISVYNITETYIRKVRHKFYICTLYCILLSRILITSLCISVLYINIHVIGK